MPPPLVCDFVGSNYFPIPAVTPVHPELMAHSRIEVVADRNPYQFGPGLAEVARRLLRELKVFERSWSKIVRVELYCELRFGESFLVETGGAHRAQCNFGSSMQRAEHSPSTAGGVALCSML